MAGAPKRSIAQSGTANEPAVSPRELAAAFDHAPVGMAITGPGAVLLRANAALATMLGYEPDELTGKSVVDLTHPDDLSDSLSGNEQLRRGEVENFSLEKRYLHKSGMVVWARVLVARLNRTPPRHLLHVVDINRERASSEQLLDTETRFREMTEAIEHDFWIMAVDPLRLIYTSPAAARIWGFDPMTNRDRPGRIRKLVHPDDLSAFTAMFDPSIPVPRELEYRITRADNGAKRWFHTRVFPVYAAAGTIDRLTGVTEDITARKEAELEVGRHRAFEEFIMRLCTEFVNVRPEEVHKTFQRSLGELASMIDADRAAIFVIDENTNVLTVGFSWSRKGISPAPSVTEFSFAPDNPLRAQIVREGLLRVDDVDALPDSLGEIRDTLIANGIGSFIDLPLVRRGKFVGLYGFGTIGRKATWPADVAARLAIAAEVFANAIERAEMENEVRKHRDALAHALRVGTMGQLASGIAHELNQPLAAILNYASAIDRRAGAGNADFAWVHDAVRKMGEQAVRAADVIRTLRSLVRKSEGARVWQNPHDLVQTAIRFLEPSLIEPGITIVTASEPDLPQVQVDPIQIEQVIINLVRNAIDAVRGMPESMPREIRIVTRASSTAFVEIRVSDSGPGIAPEKLDHLFDEFFTTKQQGLGLGLSISRSIVESHGGTLWLDSTSAAGSTFRFTLPSSQP